MKLCVWWRSGGLFSLFPCALWIPAQQLLSLCVWHLFISALSELQHRLRNRNTSTAVRQLNSKVWLKPHKGCEGKKACKLQKQQRKLCFNADNSLFELFAWEMLINYIFICERLIAPTLIIPLNHPPLSLPCGHLALWGNKCVEFLWGLFGNLSAVNLQVNTTDQRPPYAGREVGCQWCGEGVKAAGLQWVMCRMKREYILYESKIRSS